ncbi:MAG: efflux RND transporter periplasmic adaptor subunit [Inquilinaceae bacterium]
MTALSRAAGLMAAVILAASSAMAQQPPSQVVVDAVRVEQMSQTAPVIGRLVARESVIAAQVEGSVETIHAIVGDQLAKGDLIVSMDAARLEADLALRQAEYREAEGSVAVANVGIDLARQTLSRLERLRQSSAFSQAAFDDAQQEVRRAQSQAAVAEAQRLRAEVAAQRAAIDLEDATVTAPFAGVIGTRDANVGEYLRIGDPIVTLINDHDLEIEAMVPADRIAGLTPGTVVDATFDGTDLFAAAVRAVVPMEDGLSRTRPVRLTPEFDSADGLLAGNQSVTVLVPVGAASDVVTVHKDAVLNGPGGGRIVYVVEDGAANVRPVRLGAAVGSRFEVLDGLGVGDLTVVRGNERLRPGQPVQYDGAS